MISFPQRDILPHQSISPVDSWSSRSVQIPPRPTWIFGTVQAWTQSASCYSRYANGSLSCTAACWPSPLQPPLRRRIGLDRRSRLSRLRACDILWLFDFRLLQQYLPSPEVSWFLDQFVGCILPCPSISALWHRSLFWVPVFGLTGKSKRNLIHALK